MTTNLNLPGIYAIVNIINGKRYVGSTANLSSRKNGHKSALNKKTHDNAHLQGAWNKYGEKCFNFVVIEYCPLEKLIEREQAYIDEKADYNIRLTAESNHGLKYSQEMRRKVSAYQLSKVVSMETRVKLSEAGKGKHHTEETKRKVSQSLMGNKRHTGIKHSPESCLHMSEAAKKRWAGIKDRSHTQEQNAKVSAGLKRYFAKQRILNFPVVVAAPVKDMTTQVVAE